VGGDPGRKRSFLTTSATQGLERHSSKREIGGPSKIGGRGIEMPRFVGPRGTPCIACGAIERPSIRFCVVPASSRLPVPLQKAPICRLVSGANRDRTGDLLLAKHQAAREPGGSITEVFEPSTALADAPPTSARGNETCQKGRSWTCVDAASHCVSATPTSPFPCKQAKSPNLLRKRRGRDSNPRRRNLPRNGFRDRYF